LAKEPRFLHRFYGSQSEMMHGNKEIITPAVGQVKIREKIKSLNFKDCHTKVAQLDAFLTIGAGICIQVAGEISNNSQPLRRFMQTFVLGPQERDGKSGRVS
jgi:Ras GTPase-activating protein-binding protein 1